MDEIVRRNYAHGGHWFTPSTVRYFGARVLGAPRKVAAGWAWVESVRQLGTRSYKIAVQDDTGAIEFVSTYDDQGRYVGTLTFGSARAAHAALRAME